MKNRGHHQTDCSSDETTRSHPYQDNSPLWQVWKELLPARPYCAFDPAQGITIRTKRQALRRPLLQFNPPHAAHWLILDIDRSDAAVAHEAALLPAPNLICSRPLNGHAHIYYALAAPVASTRAARPQPLRYLAAIQRGMTRRIGADPGYTGVLAKNPLWPEWRAQWLAPFPYQLAELAAWLDPADMRAQQSVEIELGFGRNCSLFDAVRKIAYLRVLDFQRFNRTEPEFQRWVETAAAQQNSLFADPLPHREVRSIAKSIARWTWRNFSREEFSRLQSNRRASLKKRRARLVQEIDP